MGNYTKSFNFRNGVQVDDSNFIVNPNGLVGIGTSIPEKRLDVRGNAKIVGDTRLVGFTSITDLNVVGVVTIGSAVKIDSGSGIITATKFVGDASGLQNIVAIATDGFIANAGTLSTTAKIGIGTTNPTSLLDVKGNISGSSLNVAGVSTFRESVNLKKTINDTYSSTTSITPIIRIRNDAGVDNTYSGLRLQAHNSNAAAATFDISVLNSSDNYKSTLVFQSKDGESAFSEKLRVTSSGNIGIGTTNPFDSFDGGFEKRFQVVSGEDESYLFSGGDFVNAEDVLSVTTKSSYGGFNINVRNQNENNPIWTIRTFENEPIAFAQGTSEIARFSSNGNLGIGTTVPDFKFQVKTGTNKFISFDNGTHDDFSGEGSAILFSRQNNGAKELSGLMSINNGGLLVGAREELVFATGGGSKLSSTDERLRITSDGKVGIGTDIPAAKLDIVGGDINVNDKFETISTGASVYNQLNVASFNGGTSGLSSHFGSLRYGNEDQSTSPFSTRRSLDLINTDSGNVNFYLNANNLSVPDDGSDFHWHKGFDNSRLMTLTGSTGRLGVGTTLPTVKLQVEGGSKITGVSTFSSDLFVGNNLNVKGVLEVSVINANVTGNLTGNINAASGISTFSAIKTTDKTATNFAGVGIGTTVSNPNYIETINSTLDKTSQFIVNTEGKVAIGTDTIRDGIGLNAHKEKATFGAVGVGTTTPLAAVDFRDAGQDGEGVFANRMYMLPPQVDNDERLGLSTVTGAVIFNTTASKLQIYVSNNWVDLH